VKLSSSNLRKAAEIQERIEQLQTELEALLGRENEQNTNSTGNAPVPVQRTGRVRKLSSERGRGRRSTSPSGPLAPAVVQILRTKDSPMSVAEILDGLLSNGYKFASPEPKKNLFARIYRLKGVKQVGPGKFAAG
jgi:hypothetical protein